MDRTLPEVWLVTDQRISSDGERRLEISLGETAALPDSAHRKDRRFMS